MPIPKPTPNEEQQHFISRCIKALKTADPGRDDKQVAAICYGEWKKPKED